MTACLEVRTKIVLFVEGRSTHSSRREENPFRCPSFSIRDRATRAKRTMLEKRQTSMFSRHEDDKTSHCKGRSREVLEPACQVGRGAWRWNWHPTTTRLLLQGVPSVFCGTTLERQGYEPERRIHVCSHVRYTPLVPSGSDTASYRVRSARACVEESLLQICFLPKKTNIHQTYWKNTRRCVPQLSCLLRVLL